MAGHGRYACRWIGNLGLLEYHLSAVPAVWDELKLRVGAEDFLNLHLARLTGSLAGSLAGHSVWFSAPIASYAVERIGIYFQVWYL